MCCCQADFAVASENFNMVGFQQLEEGAEHHVAIDAKKRAHITFNYLLVAAISRLCPHAGKHMDALAARHAESTARFTHPPPRDRSTDPFTQHAPFLHQQPTLHFTQPTSIEHTTATNTPPGPPSNTPSDPPINHIHLPTSH